MTNKADDQVGVTVVCWIGCGGLLGRVEQIIRDAKLKNIAVPAKSCAEVRAYLCCDNVFLVSQRTGFEFKYS